MHRPIGFAALTAVLLLAGPAEAEIIKFTNGRSTKGLVIEVTSREVVVRTMQGRKSYKRSVVSEIRPSDDPKAEFAEHLAAVKKRDVEAAWDLVLWAKRTGYDDEHLAALARVLEINPDHKLAHLAMGHVRKDSRWMTKAESVRWEADRRRHDSLVAKYRKMLGETPKVVLTPHWQVVDLLSDGAAESRASDLENAWGETLAVLGEPNPWKDRGLVVLCRDLDTYAKWVKADVKGLRGMKPAILAWVLKSTGMKWNEPAVLGRVNLPSRSAMHAANLHAAGHLLVNRWRGYNRKAPFWIEEGYGGWLEERMLQSRSSYCFELQDKDGYDLEFRASPDWDVEQPSWKELAKRAADDDGFLPLEQLDLLPRAQYGRREVGQSFALVAYLLAGERRARFKDYLKKVKEGRKSADALKAVYGMTWPQLEKDWKRWVREEW